VPTYQYACTECGHTFEQFQSFSDDTLTECPACSGRLRKIFNAVGVVFKGSGFYRTDSRSGPSATLPADGATSSTEKPAAEKAPAKSDSKPAAAASSTSPSKD
jgi:putative FmdB family regulatory protein